MVRSFTPQAFLQNWVTRIDPEQAGDLELTLGFRFPDVNEEWALEVRRGVAQLHRGIPEGTELRLSMDKRFMETLLTGEGGLVKGALLGDVQVEGNLLEIRRFRLRARDPLCLHGEAKEGRERYREKRHGYERFDEREAPIGGVPRGHRAVLARTVVSSTSPPVQIRRADRRRRSCATGVTST